VTPLDHALAYAALGWRVAPIKPGFKFPKGMEDWQERATTDEATIRKWWGKYPTYGVSIVAGVTSNIVWLDVDPRHGGDETLADLEHEHGRLPDTVESLTGGGGRHIGFKMPPGRVITNDAGKRLGPGLDVRGEGGQIVAPPSIHPETGRPYAWEVFNNPLDGVEVADMPPWLVGMLTAPLTAPTPRRAPRTTGTRLMERPGDRYNAEAAWADILSADGWSIHSGRRGRDGDYELWTRPGKSADEGASASLYYGGSNSLKVFTSSIPGLTQDQAYDPLGYLAATKHGGDIGRAVKALGDEYRKSNGSGATGTATKATPPPNVNPTTGEIAPPLRNLPDEFWNSRQVLAHIRQAAHHRLRSADAVLLCVLARVSASTPSTYHLPALASSRGSLNFIAALVGSSGTGKSSAADVAEELLPIRRDDVIQLAVGSGEGLIESYFEWGYDENDEGKKIRVKKRAKDSALFKLDEGQALIEMASRKGSTLHTNLRSAWSGGQVGQANATQETFRMLEAGTYRMAMQMGFQLEYAAQMLDDSAGGTPQRFVFATAVDPMLPDEDVDWPGEIHLPVPHRSAVGTTIPFAAPIRAEVRARSRAVTRGELVLDPLDTHADLLRMKVAALLALLEARPEVTEDDWRLAGEVMRVSGLVRSWALEHARAVSAASEEAHATRLGKRTLLTEDMQHEKALKSGSGSIGRKVWREKAPVPRSDLNRAPAGKHREHCSTDDMIALALAEGWIAAVGDAFERGPNRPPGM
jgi:hypothetical protein